MFSIQNFGFFLFSRILLLFFWITCVPQRWTGWFISYIHILFYTQFFGFFFVFPNFHRFLLITYYFQRWMGRIKSLKYINIMIPTQNFVSLSFSKLYFFIFSELLIISQRWTGRFKSLKYINIMISNQNFDFFVVFPNFLYFFWIIYYFPKVNGANQYPQIHQYLVIHPNFRFIFLFPNFLYFFLNYLFFS